MIKASEINISTVSGQQIGSCHKTFEGSQAVWMVQSEQDELVEYKVKHTKEHGFTCTCKAGLTGFSNCKAGYCKHVLWSVAAEAELRTAMKELEMQIALDRVMSDTETVKAAEKAAEAPVKPARKSSAKAYQPKAFSILKV